MSSDEYSSDHGDKGRQVIESEELNNDHLEIGTTLQSENDETDAVHQSELPSGQRIRSVRVSTGEISDIDYDNGAASLERHDRLSSSGGFDAQYSSNDEISARNQTKLGVKQEPPSYQIPPDDSDYSSDEKRSASAVSLSHNIPSGQKPKRRPKANLLKRKSSTNEPEHALATASDDFRPVKMAKHAFNRAYLDLLNQDIKHAVAQSLVEPQDVFDGRSVLPESQIGLSVWMPQEKERFFEALGRLGRDDADGIAQRVGTKGVMEVRQYMKLLQDSLTFRRQQNELLPLEMSDFPAAIELSHECCIALEDMADSLALRQDKFESSAEEQARGPDWLVSQSNHKELPDTEKIGATLKAADIFRVPEWLSLAERFFMNAPSEDGNWQSVDGETPSIRLTTLEDFQSLATTLTRRLVASTLYMAATRIRAERGTGWSTRSTVKVRDVEAAAISLGLHTRKPPLIKCARRLGLAIYEEPPKPHEETEDEAMPYDAVEEDLGLNLGPSDQRGYGRIQQQMTRMALSSDSDSISSNYVAESDDTDSEAAHGEMQSSPDEEESGDEDEAGAEAEANEAILHSAVDPPQTKRDRQALLRRVKAERAQERFAEAVDAQASYDEELHMWEDILEEQPPQALTEPRPLPRERHGLKLAVDAAYATGRDWRAQTKLISEWETQYLYTR